MQNIKKTLKSKRFWFGTVLPFVLAVAAAFVARYQLEISDGELQTTWQGSGRYTHRSMR